MARTPAWNARRTPTQQRARDTVDVILEAAAQVFAERGYAAGTSNRIAARAGVSVGSFYQYFPNKDAVLVALVERHLEAGMRAVEQLLETAAAEPGDLEATLRSFVSAMLALHEREPDLHRVLFEEAPHPAELHECVLRAEERLAHIWRSILRELPRLRVRDSDTAAHLLVQLTEALTHRFVLHGLHELPSNAFIEEVVTLLKRYLMEPEAQSGGVPQCPSSAESKPTAAS